MRKFLTLFLIGLFVASVGITVADDSKSIEAFRNYHKGHYVDMTWRDKIKLYTAAYVDPTLAKQTSVVTFYDWSTFTNSKFSELKGKAMMGEIAFMHADGRAWLITDSEDILEMMTSKSETAALQQYRLVSYEKEILGLEPAGEMISWTNLAPWTR